MKNNKVIKGISLTLTMCMLLSASAFAKTSTSGKTNSKNQSTSNSNDAKNYMVNQGIMNGDSNGNLNMSGNVKRGDVAVMIARAFDLTSDSTSASASDSKSDADSESFADVPTSSYYSKAIVTMRSRGIAKGDGTNFNPESYVTLKEAITFVERAMEKADSSLIVGDAEGLEAMFDDSTLSDYATREDVANMLYYILTGDVPTDSSKDSDTQNTDEQNSSSQNGNKRGNSSNNVNNQTNVSTINYTTAENTTLTFSGDDFSNISDDATDDTLSYVKFMLPSTTYGILYNGSTAVSASTEYYVDSSPYISNVSFVPTTSYVGTISITYKAYNSDGELLYTGKVRISIGESSTTASTAIAYSTYEETAVTFNADDFSTVNEATSSDTLSYVKFTLPSSSYGTLYYGDSKISAATKYSVSSTPYISSVSFKPTTGYTGTAPVAYKAYNSSGTLLYTGTVKIAVLANSTTSTAIYYTTAENTKITFDSDDFSSICEYTTTGILSYVKFTLPSATYGTLYNGSSKVSSATKYYVSATPYISSVSFKPTTSYTGTVSVTYKAYNSSGTLLYTGSVQITVD